MKIRRILKLNLQKGNLYMIKDKENHVIAGNVYKINEKNSNIYRRRNYFY